jgi:ABC-2 type transport system permease protein
MRGSVARRALLDGRRAFAWWAAGLAAYVGLITSVYPTIRDNPELDRLVESYPEALQAFIAFGGQLDFTSAAGYLGSELFSFMMPAIFLVAAIGHGARSVAGEEERGTLDLLLSTPVSRRRVAVEKLAALVVELAALGVVLWAALWAGTAAVGMDISAAHLASATTMLVLLSFVYGAAAYGLAAATGRRTLSIAVSAALAVAGYLVDSLAALVDTLEPAQRLSPFYHYSVANPLEDGIDPTRALLLAVIAAGSAVCGVVLFDRRDLRS